MDIDGDQLAHIIADVRKRFDKRRTFTRVELIDAVTVSTKQRTGNLPSVDSLDAILRVLRGLYQGRIAI